MEEHPGLQALIAREFNQEGDLEQALEMVRSSRAILAPVNWRKNSPVNPGNPSPGWSTPRVRLLA